MGRIFLRNPVTVKKGQCARVDFKITRHFTFDFGACGSVATSPSLAIIINCRPVQSDVLPDLSAGQFCLVKHMSQLVAQPGNPLTHKMLAHYYQLPSQDPTLATPSSKPGQVLVGTTVDHLTTLPKSNRINPLVICKPITLYATNNDPLQLTPPPISQDDAGKGLLSLLERGLIPVRTCINSVL